MTRLFARAVGCAIFGALAGAAAMILLSGLDPRFTLEMTQDRPGLLRGFYPGERDGALTFAWTADRAEMPLAGLDRNVPWTARIRVRGGRRDPATLPTLTVLADNVPVATRQTSNTFEELEATIPARTGHVRGVTLALAVSNTFVPGPDDARALGVQIDRISVEPATLGAFPPRRTVAAAALGSAVFGAVFGLLAATATTAVGAATLVAVAQATVLRIGLGPFAPWLTLVEALAASIGIALLVVALVVERWRHERLRHTARFALMFTGAALYLHLLVLLHPDKLLADATSHAARLLLLRIGAFSYPIAFYVAALPFVHLATDLVSLLWIVAAVAEAISFLFFYWMIVRGTGDRVLAAIAVAVVQLLPIGFQFMAEAHLTAVFGQAATLVTMSLATAALLDRRPWQFWATGAAALVAFLSDIGTLTTLASTLAAWIASVDRLRQPRWTQGGRCPRDHARGRRGAGGHHSIGTIRARGRPECAPRGESASGAALRAGTAGLGDGAWPHGRRAGTPNLVFRLAFSAPGGDGAGRQRTRATIRRLVAARLGMAARDVCADRRGRFPR